MPAKNAVAPDQLPGRIHAWLAANPGAHRVTDIAQGLGQPPEVTKTYWTRHVGRACSREYLSGKLTRAARRVEGRKTPITTYSA